jgi:type I restriction enzyme S subunit
MLSVYRDYGVIPREGRVDNHNRPGENLAAYRVVRRGDLVLNKMKTWQGSLGISQFEGVVSPAYFVARPLTDDVPGFLHHLLRSRPLIAEYGARSKGIRPSQWDLGWDEFRNIAVELPTVEEQQAIADYLDTELARIDALIEKKQRMVGLLEDRIVAHRSAWYGRLAQEWGTTPLRRAIQRVEQGWSPQCDNVAAESAEWGVLKTSSVSKGVFAPEENKRLPESENPDLRWTVSDGDLLIVRGSGSASAVGQAAVATVGGRKLLFSDLLYRIRLVDAQPEFVVMALQSSQVRSQLESAIRTDTGQTLKIRGDDIRSLLIPSVPPAKHAGAVQELSALISQVRDGCRCLEQSILLLQEHRQSLITAAVTGELDIPGVAA